MHRTESIKSASNLNDNGGCQFVRCKNFFNFESDGSSVYRIQYGYRYAKAKTCGAHRCSVELILIYRRSCVHCQTLSAHSISDNIFYSENSFRKFSLCAQLSVYAVHGSWSTIDPSLINSLAAITKCNHPIANRSSFR